MAKRTMCWASVLMALVAASSTAWGQYDVYKLSQDGTSVPDVNKLGGAGDLSCWQAAAANLLGAAGWGLPANTAQQNATQIYGQMTAHFGTNWPGREELAVNWWLMNYGLNPNAGVWYTPSVKYTDVTHVYNPGGLTQVDYGFLLNELQRCQYVAVSFDTGASVGHVMTLVGGNFPINPPAVSVWHDSDDLVNGDNVMNHAFVGAPPGVWQVQYPLAATPWIANDYTTLCPGLVKPVAAMNNYDVQYFKDMDTLSGVWFNSLAVRGAKGGLFAPPMWGVNGETLTIGNEEVSNQVKDVYLLVDYLDRNNNVDPGIRLTTPFEALLVPQITYSADFGQIMLHWHLGYQPAWETIVFPSADYFNLAGDVKDFNVATVCSPEPASVGLLVVGGLMLLCRRRM